MQKFSSVAQLGIQGKYCMPTTLQMLHFTQNAEQANISKI